MKAIQIISQDVFDKVRSRFQNLEMGDETGAVTIDPAEARFFDFDFVYEGANLGRVSISLNDLGSLKVYYSQGITENHDDPAKKMWYSFLKEMRMFAMRRLLRFDTRDIAKTNLDKTDFQYLANKSGNKEEPMKTMNESRWNNKSTKKTSRAVRGATEVIVRHHNTVDEMYPGARSQRKNIKAIFIQNHDGERFKYPFIHPAGAFAMAQHVDHGGIPHDPAGKAIIKMSEQIAQLQEFQRQVQHTSLHDDAMGIKDRACGRLLELKSMIEALGKRHHYENWVAEFDQSASVDDDLMELDPVTMEDYKSKFTQTNFKEELASFFPLIHKIMQETNAINLEDYVSEEEECEVCHESPCGCDDDEVKESVNDFDQFESWAEAIEQGKMSDDEIADLKQALADLPQGQLSLDTAYNFFNEFGINDEDLEQKFQQAKELDSTTDAMAIFKLWAEENYPELLVALGMSDTQAPPEQAPMEPAPVDQVPAPVEQPVAEGAGQPSMVKEVARIVKSFYNRDNPEVGPFRGCEGIALDVKKQVAEKFGDDAGEQAAQMAEAFMEKLTNEWQERHGKTAGVADDGLARLKELVSNIKTKVEGIGDQGQSGQDFNNNIMPAEEDVKKEKEPEGTYSSKRHETDGQRIARLAKEKRQAQNKERMKNDFDAEMERESVEMESILKLAGLAK